MEKAQKFGRYSKRVFKRLLTREEVKDENLNFTTHIQEEQRVITWHLENFYRCPLKTEEYHQSHFFCTGFSSSTKWALRIYPQGKTTPGKVGLFIHREPANSKVAIEFDLAVKVPDMENAKSVLTKKNTRMDSEELGSEIHPPCNNFLRQKSVKIICSLTVGYVDEADDVETCNAGSPLCSLSSDLKAIYSSGKFFDITLQAGKKHFPAHKAILSARSSVFSAMFDHPMEESQTNIVKIDDVEPSVVSDLLHYMYACAVEDLNVDKACALFAAADKYCLEDLQKRCVRVMLAKLCVENVCQIATLADMHSEQKLKAATNYIFRKYKHEIFDRKEWSTMIQKRPLLATEILQNVSTDFRTICSDP